MAEGFESMKGKNFIESVPVTLNQIALELKKANELKEKELNFYERLLNEPEFKNE